QAVPNNREMHSGKYPACGNANMTPSKGAISVTGKPVTSQCTRIFASTVKYKGCGLISICSSEPSSKSLRNKPSRDNKVANSAITQIIPGAILASTPDSGLMPKG